MIKLKQMQRIFYELIHSSFGSSELWKGGPAASSTSRDNSSGSGARGKNSESGYILEKMDLA